MITGLSAFSKNANSICSIFLNLTFPLFLFHLTFADIDILYKKEICEESEFYSPYVKLLKTRQPHHEHSPILKLLKAGYIDVSRHTGILCINGPAVVYNDIVHDTGCTNDSTLSWIPASGQPQMFSHECFSFNRLPREEYRRSQQEGLKKESRVFGNRVFGVYLIGQSPDYRLSNFVFFPQSDFGFRQDAAWCINNGASLAFLTNSSDSSTHCYSVKKYNMDGVISVEFVGNPVFCYREDQDSEFDTPWHKGSSSPLTSQDITWENCGTSTLDLTPKEYEPEPGQLPDFRMIHPKFWSSQGSQGVMWKAKRKPGEVEDAPVFSKPNPPGSLFPGEPGWKDPSDFIHLHISGTGDFKVAGSNDETATADPYQKFQVDIPDADCEEVPKPADVCKDDLTGECSFLMHVLTLEETDWNSVKLQDGRWRLPIFHLIDSIYAKACPQITKFLAPALSRLFQYFLNQAIEAEDVLEGKFKEHRKREWDEMLMDLERCNEKAEMMKFFRRKDQAAVKSKRKLEAKLNNLQKRVSARLAAMSATSSVSSSGVLLQTFPMNNANHTADLAEMEKIQSHLNEFTFKFPYKILIGSANKPEYSEATKVYQFREAAEIDHELDFALDTYWKVVSTVLGYCNVHYSSRDSATYMRLYGSFTQDFFEYVSKFWISGDKRQIYEQLFGEFIYGSGVLWLDACHDGAYQWSGTSDRRPLRPITLLEGDVAPGAAAGRSLTATSSTSTPTNFFVDNPAFTHLNGDDTVDDAVGSGNSQEAIQTTTLQPIISLGMTDPPPVTGSGDTTDPFPNLI